MKVKSFMAPEELLKEWKQVFGKNGDQRIRELMAAELKRVEKRERDD